MPHGSENVTFDLLVASIQLLQHGFDLCPFGSARTGAGVLFDRPLHLRCKAYQSIFIGISQWANQCQSTVKKGLGGHHGTYFTRVTHIEEQRLDDIILVMGQGQLAAPQLPGYVKQSLAAQTGTQKARIFPVSIAVGHQTMVRLLDADIKSHGMAMLGDGIGRAPLETGIDKYGKELELHRRSTLQRIQKPQKRPAVFAP
jgi:hypothetical protein